MIKEFKAGDKVYYPPKSTKVLTIRERDDSEYPISSDPPSRYAYTFTIDGKSYIEDALPSIFHATPETKAKLEDFYGVEFEAPSSKSTSLEIIQAMLDIEKLPIPCWASNIDEQPSSINKWVFIDQVIDGNYPFVDKNGGRWKYTTPFDHKTLQPITHDRDINAAKNILTAGLAGLAFGENVSLV